MYIEELPKINHDNRTWKVLVKCDDCGCEERKARRAVWLVKSGL